MCSLIKEINLENWHDFIMFFCEAGEPKYAKQNIDKKEVEQLKTTCIWRGQADAKWEIQANYFRDKHEQQNDYAYLNTNSKFVKFCTDLSRHYARFFNEYTAIIDNQCQNKSCIVNTPINGSQGPLAIFQNGNADALKENSNFDLLFNNKYNLSDWAWAQHYGVKTPLVDWTKFPFYALFFAAEELNQENSSMAVFALNDICLSWANTEISYRDLPFTYYENGKDINVKNNLEIDDIVNMIKEKDYVKGLIRIDFIEKFLELPKPHCMWVEARVKEEDLRDTLKQLKMTVEMCKLKTVFHVAESKQENARIIRQGALFTHAPLGFSVEKWLRKVEKICDYKEPTVLYKFIIKSNREERIDCIKYLNMMNINHATIYPDFEGLAKSVNLGNELRSDSLFRSY